MKNRFRLNLFRFVLLLSVCVSCSQEYDKALEDALNLAGENRPELEKVLRHYHGDTLKLEAAKFLFGICPVIILLQTPWRSNPIMMKWILCLRP